MKDDELQTEIATAIVDRWRIAMTEESIVLGTAQNFAEVATPIVRRYAEDFAAAKLREVALWMELNGYDDAAVDNVIRRAQRLTGFRLPSLKAGRPMTFEQERADFIEALSAQVGQNSLRSFITDLDALTRTYASEFAAEEHCGTCECIHQPCGYVVGTMGCVDFHERADALTKPPDGPVR